LARQEGGEWEGQKNWQLQLVMVLQDTGGFWTNWQQDGKCETFPSAYN
jgi:hypothetical protein